MQGARICTRKDVAILVDRRGGGVRPMTLREFRERLEADDKGIKKEPLRRGVGK